jgi:hypothetical protein
MTEANGTKKEDGDHEVNFAVANGIKHKLL